jgi:uncharacterized protein YceH (UPF0502 family)
LFSGEVHVEESATAEVAASPEAGGPSNAERIERLEDLVASLRRELDELKAQLK